MWYGKDDNDDEPSCCHGTSPRPHYGEYAQAETDQRAEQAHRAAVFQAIAKVDSAAYQAIADLHTRVDKLEKQLGELATLVRKTKDEHFRWTSDSNLRELVLTNMTDQLRCVVAKLQYAYWNYPGRWLTQIYDGAAWTAPVAFDSSHEARVWAENKLGILSGVVNESWEHHSPSFPFAPAVTPIEGKK